MSGAVSNSLTLAACALTLAGASCARHYRAEGLVLRIDAPRATALISHREITGYMPAMAMPFRVRNPRQLTILTPGNRVRFRLNVRGGGSNIDRIERQPSDTEGIRLDPPREQTPVGGMPPDFSLNDQSGAIVRLSDLRGKLAVLDFIYTRCPLPDVCPRLSANFASLQRRFSDRLGKELVLLSITIDPQYDTPEVLSRYGKIWGANPSGWHFLTGDVDAVQRVAASFGLIFWPEEGLLTHTSRTAIVGKDGRLRAVVEGPNYAASQLVDLIQSELEGP